MNSTSIHIRRALSDDHYDLWKLSVLDSALVPAEPLLVAESDGELVAALSLSSGEGIGDPFRRSGEALELLRLRARQLPRRPDEPRRGGLARLRPRPLALPGQ
jgi:hypothetical protein